MLAVCVLWRINFVSQGLLNRNTAVVPNTCTIDTTGSNNASWAVVWCVWISCGDQQGDKVHAARMQHAAMLGRACNCSQNYVMLCACCIRAPLSVPVASSQQPGLSWDHLQWYYYCHYHWSYEWKNILPHVIPRRHGGVTYLAYAWWYGSLGSSLARSLARSTVARAPPPLLLIVPRKNTYFTQSSCWLFMGDTAAQHTLRVLRNITYSNSVYL